MAARSGAASAMEARRGLRWRQQLQLLPEGDGLRRLRRAYGQEKKQFLSKPTGEEQDLVINNPLSSDPNSAWAKWWKTEASGGTTTPVSEGTFVKAFFEKLAFPATAPSRSSCARSTWTCRGFTPEMNSIALLQCR